MPALGVVGTMVWDRIFPPGADEPASEGWGGVTYALAALESALPTTWEIVPIVKIGRDRADEVLELLTGLDRVRRTSAVRVVEAGNNRVELRYRDRARRTEHLSGGVPPWRGRELDPVLPTLDALYVNFISGMEMDLDAARRVRRRFDGPIYADLHSLLLGIEADGRRTLRPLPAWRAWVRSFDAVQVNEDELAALAPAGTDDPWRFAADLVPDDSRLVLVTLGAYGAGYTAPAGFGSGPAAWRAAPGRQVSQCCVPAETRVADADPTGCGDVWGATCFARLLAGADLDAALRDANRAAAKSARHRGTNGLQQILQQGNET